MYSVRFYTNLEFLDRFSLKSPIPNFTEIPPLEAVLINAERRTGMKKVRGAVRGYANAPKREGKKPFVRPTIRWKDYIKMHL
jgi:hypothetical protein